MKKQNMIGSGKTIYTKNAKKPKCLQAFTCLRRNDDYVQTKFIILKI